MSNLGILMTSTYLFKGNVVFCAILFLTCFNSCSPGSAVSTPGLAGSLLGASAGVAGGLVLSEYDSSFESDEAALLLGGSGAAIGLLSGGLMHENRVNKERAMYYERVLLEKDNRQEEIERMSRYLDESGSWGRSEVDPYEDVYDDGTIRPYYQGK